MPSTAYVLRTEQNVIDSSGTLIVSHGKLTDGSDYTRKMAVKHHRPWLHVDLNKTPAFKAVTLICSWIDENAIEILNVAGPRASKDDQIYPAVLKIIESVHYMELMTTVHPQAVNFQNNGRASTQQQPETLREAIEILISNLPLREKRPSPIWPKKN
jgi:hypothetical protein